MALLMASLVLCLLLGKRKVKVNPSLRHGRLRRHHPWAEEATVGALPARPSKERGRWRALKKRCTFGKGTPDRTCVSAGSSLAFYILAGCLWNC